MKDLWLVYTHARTITRENGYGEAAPAEQRKKLMEAVSDFYDNTNRFAQYMRMDQKLIRTPAEWFRDQNKKRLSYGDQP